MGEIQIEKGCKGGDGDYIENIDNDITNNQQSSSVKRAGSGRLEGQIAHRAIYDHKSHISHENEKWL